MGIGYNPASGVDPAALEDVKALAEEGIAAGRNAREMVLRRDEKLDQAVSLAQSADSRYDTLEEIAASYAQALPASVEDRAALHRAVDALTTQVATVARTPGPAGKDGRDGTNGRDGAAGTNGKDGANGKDADMSRVEALEKRAVVVAFGAANLPASIAAGATTNIVVPLSRSMGTASYSTGYALAGGVSLLGNVQAVAVVAQTATSVTVAVKNTGLTALVNLSTTSVSVVAARDA